MAAIRGICRPVLRYISSPNSVSLAQLICARGFSSKLFVKGISFQTTEKTLSDAFSQYGKVLEAQVVMDKVSNRPKGFAFVTFSTVDEARTALVEMDGKTLDGRILHVDIQKPRFYSGGMPIARGPPDPKVDK